MPRQHFLLAISGMGVLNFNENLEPNFALRKCSPQGGQGDMASQRADSGTP